MFAPKPNAVPGVANGRLASCSSRPNCVSSVAADPGHYVSPIAYSERGDAAFARLRALIESLTGASIIAFAPPYMHAEFKSRVFGFVDDVECLLDAVDRRIHIRSASRVGHYDFGANRKRVEDIRAQFSRQSPGRRSTEPLGRK